MSGNWILGVAAAAHRDYPPGWSVRQPHCSSLAARWLYPVFDDDSEQELSHGQKLGARRVAADEEGLRGEGALTLPLPHAEPTHRGGPSCSRRDPVRVPGDVLRDELALDRPRLERGRTAR